MRYDESMRLADARKLFFRRGGFACDGGYAAACVRFRLGPAAFAIPNTAARRRAVPLHDLHHIVTGYDTTWTGEAEIAAWELGSGCSRYGAAWALNLMAFPLGLLIAPRRTWRAFRRSRSHDNLYNESWQDAWLEETVGAMSLRLGLNRPPTSSAPIDLVLFILCALPALVGIAGLAAGAGLLWRWFA